MTGVFANSIHSGLGVSSAGVLFSLFITALAAPSGEKPLPDLAKEKILFAVGYAHLDTQWRWTYRETIGQYIPDTMKKNFALFEKYPDYVFNFSGANRYRMMKEYYPADYEKVKEYVRRGRWFPCGSSMEECDVNVPSPESLIRQVLYGNHFFKKELGVASAEFMLPDCFGFPASLPAILAHCGLRGFSTQKLTWKSAMGIPFNLGVWEGPGGAGVIAALNPGNYVGKIEGDLSRDPRWIQRVNENGNKYGVFADYHYYGTGDVGGAPTEDSVKWLEAGLKGGGPLRVVSSRADELFKAITPAQRKTLPRYQGDLLLIEHSAGSITSQAYMKRWNRKAELLADAAERAAVAASWLGGAPYPRKKLNDAWTLVMGGQFHDILPGTSVPKAYEYSWNDLILAQNLFAQVLTDSVGAVARALDTRGPGKALVVYYPNPVWGRIAEATLEFEGGPPKAVLVTDVNGQPVWSQILATEGKRVRFIFDLNYDISGHGYYVYHAEPVEKLPEHLESLKNRNRIQRATEREIDNGMMRVRINGAGDVSSIYDKYSQRELLDAPVRLAFQTSNPREYPAWNVDWADQQKPPAGYVDGPAKITLVESGPVRATIQVEREARGSRFVQRVSLFSSTNRLEFHDTIDWKTTSSLLKAVFPLTITNTTATYGWGLGTVRRGTNRPNQYEVPNHDWLDLSNPQGWAGVMLMTGYKYGSDKPDEHTIRLTLLYTPGVRAGYPDQATQDWGRHEIRYGLLSHDRLERSPTENGESFNNPLFVFEAPAHDGPLGRRWWLANIGGLGEWGRPVPAAAAIRAVKLAEDSDEVVVRVAEWMGREARPQGLSFGSGKILEAREVNGQEEPVGPAKLWKGTLNFDLKAYGVRAFALKLGPPPVRLAPADSKPVALPFNVCVTSRDGAAAREGFDAEKRCLAAEMLPETVEAEGVAFRLGPRDGDRPNAVACAGQKIDLPQGKYNRIYLLAASSDGDVKEKFKVDEKTMEVDVRDWSGFIGQWDNRVWNDVETGDLKSIEPGFIKPGAVAWFSSHRHDAAGQNLIYEYSYLYKITLDIAPGAKELTLPRDARIKILAAAVAQNENDATRPAQPLLDELPRADFDGGRYAYKPAGKP